MLRLEPPTVTKGEFRGGVGTDWTLTMQKET